MVAGTRRSRAAWVLVLVAMLTSALGVSAVATSASPVRPVWASALGPGVVVLPPAPAASGHGSPGAAYQGVVDAIERRNLELMCQYFQPSFQAVCRRGFKDGMGSSTPSFKNFALGYTAVEGKQALVGWTGTSCVPTQHPLCLTNVNPAALFVSHHTFKVLWAQAIASATSNQNINNYALTPSVKVGTRWYTYLPAS
jgi:hypothetical protein